MLLVPFKSLIGDVRMYVRIRCTKKKKRREREKKKRGKIK